MSTKTFPNKYPGTCHQCNAAVAAQAGTTHRGPDGWLVTCPACRTGDTPTPQQVDHPLTDEQVAAVTMFTRGESMVIEAGAGAGKTSTLVAMANAAPDRRGQYLAFNRGIVQEAKGKFPRTIACNTAHSLAFRAVGHQFKSRLDNRKRIRSDEVAKILNIRELSVNIEGSTKRLPAPFLAATATRALRRFCQSADPAPAAKHFERIEGLDLPDRSGNPTHANHDAVVRHLLPAVERAWLDVSSPDGVLPYTPDFYLKLWQLSDPKIPVDFVLIDEAQDLSPVLAAIVEQQTHAQLVFVGDASQAIYRFTGAIDAMSNFETPNRCTLSRSFRFGPPIAEVANRVLAELGASLRIVGHDPITSTVGMVTEPDAVLCRTNAAAVRRVIEAVRAGVKVHLVGGGTEVTGFCEAALELQAGRQTLYPDLAIFGDWGEVQRYVDSPDEDGGDLKLLVALVDEFGADVILDALARSSSAATADLVVSTAHKSKGLQFGAVQLADDFPKDPGNVSADELMLLYVAVTRAQFALDITAVGCRTATATRLADRGVLA